VLDPRIPDGLTQIRQGWTLDDVCHAHSFLDELDAAEARAESRARDAAGGRP
jgi:hypothetical protein